MCSVLVIGTRKYIKIAKKSSVSKKCLNVPSVASDARQCARVSIRIHLVSHRHSVNNLSQAVLLLAVALFVYSLYYSQKTGIGASSL